MNGYPYPSRPYQGNGSTLIEDMGVNGMDTFDMDGQSLDQIVSQNDQAENFRRRSMPVYPNRQTQQMQMGSPGDRRLSVLNFGDPSFPRVSGEIRTGRNPADLAINTQFQSQNSPYSAMPASASAYASPMHRNRSLELDMSPYPNGMSMAMDMDESFNMLSADMTMFQNTHFTGGMMNSPVAQEHVGPKPAPVKDNNISSLQSQDSFKRSPMSNTPETHPSGQPSRTSSQDKSSMRSNSRPQSEQHSSSKTSVPTQMSLTSLKKQQPIAQDPGQDLPKEKMNQVHSPKQPWSPSNGGLPSMKLLDPYAKSHFKNAYSSTGFDMLGILVRSAAVTRPECADSFRCAWLQGRIPKSTSAL
jgi:hypothetical protein